MSTIFEQDFAAYAVCEGVDIGVINSFVFSTVVTELQLLTDGITSSLYLPLIKSDFEMYFDRRCVEEFSLDSDFVDQFKRCLDGLEVGNGRLFWKGRFLPNQVDDHMRFLAWRVFVEFGQGQEFAAGLLTESSVRYGERFVSRFDASLSYSVSGRTEM